MTICELRQRFLKIPILSSNPGRFFSISAVIACLILYPWVAGCIVPCTTKSHLASRDLLIRPRHGLRHLSRFSKSILTSIFLAPIYQFLKKQLNPNENYSKISSEAFSGQDWYMIMMFIWYFFVVKMSDNDKRMYISTVSIEHLFRERIFIASAASVSIPSIGQDTKKFPSKAVVLCELWLCDASCFT